MILTDQQRSLWEDEGFLVIPGFFSDAEVETVIAANDMTWSLRPSDVTVDDLVSGERKRASRVSDHDRSNHSFKMNDLYLAWPEIRQVSLSERLGAILAELMDDEPILCNTLNLKNGSQQEDHLDTLYMTPATPDKLVATWMALEDSHSDAGPLRYWPGSNHIDTYRFSNGGIHIVPEEMDRWAEYMADQVDSRGLEEQKFCAQRGDLFIWHGWLLHGGSQIKNPQLTRNSLISHYWARSDVTNRDLQPAPGGKWWRRPSQPVPGEKSLSEVEKELTGRVENDSRVTSESVALTERAETSLFERMRRLVSSRH